MEYDINLNIHYTAPKEVWDKINEVTNPCHTGQEMIMK